MLRQGGQDVFGSAPAWLRDDRLVFNHCQGDDCGLFEMRPDGNDLHQLTSSPHDTNPHISPDGKFIAFMSRQNDNFDIYVTAIGGGSVTQLTHHNAHDGLSAWSPDGKWIAFVSNRTGQWAVWAITQDGSREQQLFALNGAPAGCLPWISEHECEGWTQERLVWIP
jgi:Tol biopolymer transport system component